MHGRSTTLKATVALFSFCGLLTGCGTFDGVPRGTTSLLEAFMPQTTPAEAAEMAVDPYSPERRYKGTTLLANAPFGGQPVYIELYLDAVEDDDPGVRAAGVRALGRHGEPEHLPDILALLEDEDRYVRFEAARALQRVHSPGVVPVLLTTIQEEEEPNADVRVAAAEALGQYPEARVIDGLIGALADRRLAVNHAVRRSLITLTGQDFGVDRAAWVGWVETTEDIFAGQQPYEYPGFQRARKPYEYLPFVPAPPSETASTPVGLDPTPGE